MKLDSLVIDGYTGRVWEEIRSPAAAVGTAHRVGAGWNGGRLNVDHFVTFVLHLKQQKIMHVFLFVSCLLKY